MGNGAMLFDVLRANVLLVDIEHFGLTIIHRGGAINIVANENTDRNNNIESYMLSTHLVYPTCYYGYFCVYYSILHIMIKVHNNMSYIQRTT